MESAREGRKRDGARCRRRKERKGKGEESERAREGAEAGSLGLAACDVVFPRSLPSLSVFSLLLFFSSCSVAPNLTAFRSLPSDTQLATKSLQTPRFSKSPFRKYLPACYLRGRAILFVAPVMVSGFLFMNQIPFFFFPPVT